MPGPLRPVIQSFDADITKYIAKVQAMKAEYASLVAMSRDAIKIDADVTAAMTKIGALKAELGGLRDREITVRVRYETVGTPPAGIPGAGGDNAAMIRELRDISASMDMATSSMGRMEEHLFAINRNVRDSAASLDMQTQMLRDNAAAHNLVAAAAGRSAAATRDAALAAAAGAAAGGGGGGGGGGGAAAAAAAGGFFGALRPSNVFGGALPTLQMAHLITMFTMEALSTIVPAAVAAGAAGAVGFQAGQNLYLRGTAMYNAQEALGGAYGGQTFGTMTGLSRNLQNAQDLAQGGVFGIAGGLRDLVGQGSGAFTGMGVQTIAMIDRGIAGMVLHNRMQAVTNALAGGTGYLRSFGDIAANIGDTLLNLAPNLPGIGPGLLGGLKGITGAASFLTGHIPGALLGAGLAGEAGYRWGGLLTGGGKLPFWMGGGKFSGLAGLAERLGLGAVGAEGAAGTGLAGFLDVAGGPASMGAALAAWLVSQAWTSPKAGVFGKQMGALQAGIGQSFGAGALPPITHALYQVSAQQAAYAAGAGPLPAPFVAMERQGMAPSEVRAKYLASLGGYAQQFAGNLADLVTAGPSAVRALQGIGVKGATLTQAFEAMSMAMLEPQQMTAASLGPGGTGRQMLQQFYKTYRTAAIGGQPGTASGLLAAGAADYIMSSTAMKSLSQVNQGLDAMTQIMTGGPAGQAALFGMLGGTPVTRGPRRAGIQLQAPPAFAKMAGALADIFTPQGAAAWQTFAGPQGLVAAQQANLDQMRTYLTLGAITGRQGAQLSAFDLQQLLPLAAHSPMAQAMIEQQAMQANIPGISVGMSYKNLVRAITGMSVSPAQAQGILTQGTKGVADIPAIAASLITGGMGGPSAIQSALTAQMAQQALALQAHPLLKGGGVNVPALQGLTSSLAAGGVKPGQMTVAVDAILKNLHVPQGVVVKVDAQINAQQARAQLDQLKNTATGTAIKMSVEAHTQQAKSELQQLAGTRMPAKTIKVNADVAQAIAGIRAAAAIAASMPNITRTITYVVRFAGATALPGMSMSTARLFHSQTGGLVPGSGSGDTVPAMLEPGEAIVPRYLVPLVAPILSAHHVPGFGAPMGSSSHFAGGGMVPVSAVSGLQPWHFGHGGTGLIGLAAGQIAFTLTGEIARAITAAGAHKIAEALVSKIVQEVSYARGVAAAAKLGQGFGASAGIFGSMDVTPGTGGGTVFEQMQSYLQTLTSFGKDITALRKGHLNKDIISQLVAAGPVQGDALAQSILQDFGGIKSINQLWAQIGKASNALGAQAAMAQYGNVLAPNLKSGSFSSTNVTVNVSLGGGAHGDLQLTPSQIRQLVAAVQKALLQQGRRNNKTGLQPRGKGP